MSIYTICGLFLYRKTAAIHNILFYVWSISIAKDRRFAEKRSPRLWWSSQIRLHFQFFLFFEGGGGGQNITKNIMVYPNKVSDYKTFTLMIT